MLEAQPGTTTEARTWSALPDVTLSKSPTGTFAPWDAEGAQASPFKQLGIPRDDCSPLPVFDGLRRTIAELQSTPQLSPAPIERGPLSVRLWQARKLAIDNVLAVLSSASGPVDHGSRPDTCPHQIPPHVEVRVLEIRLWLGDNRMVGGSGGAGDPRVAPPRTVCLQPVCPQEVFGGRGRRGPLADTVGRQGSSGRGVPSAGGGGDEGQVDDVSLRVAPADRTRQRARFGQEVERAFVAPCGERTECFEQRQSHVLGDQPVGTRCVAAVSRQHPLVEVLSADHAEDHDGVPIVEDVDGVTEHGLQVDGQRLNAIFDVVPE